MLLRLQLALIGERRLQCLDERPCSARRQIRVAAEIIFPTWLLLDCFARFGEESYVLRTAVAFVGGAAMVYGARMAGGCTSGHGISGTMQLAVGSWIAVICFFIGGIAAAMLMYRI